MTDTGTVFISFYYETIGWQALIKEMILPAVGPNKKNMQDERYFIHLNNARGSHIGLTILASHKRCDELAEKFYKNAKAFFQKKSIKRKKMLSLPVTIFKDFPANSVHFNQHRFPFLLADAGDNNEVLLRITEMLSKNIMTAFSEDLMDAFTIAYYLHAVYFKSCFKTAGSSVELITSLSDDLCKNNGRVDSLVSSSAYTIFYEENKIILCQIMQDVFLLPVANKREYVWLNNWLSLFEDIAAKTKQSGQFKERDFFWTMNVITTQLGIDAAITGVILYFFRKCLVQ